MKKYKVAYATGSRADYGIVKNYLRLLEDDNEINFSVLVTGSHLEKKFGYSVDIIKKDGFKIECEIPLQMKNDSNANVVKSMAVALDKFGAYFEVNKMDLLIVLGDRYEMMAVVTAAAIQKIPILHLHGGETTYGNYDEFIRHCITKMSYYHFTSTDVYRQRVIQLGESPERVFYMGALGAENCKNIELERIEEAVLKIPIKKYWVVVFHPETLTNINMIEQVREVLAAIDMLQSEMQFVFVGTNADTKSDIIRDAWFKYVNAHENTYYFENLNVDSYLWLVKNSIALLGNSSSGIIEAPSLGVYSINIGDRQKGRVYGNSILNVPCSKENIVSAMHKVLQQIKKNSLFDNPYYLENTAFRYYRKTKELLCLPNTTIKEFYDL